MENEDDMIVVIVGDEDEENVENTAPKIKTEVIDDENYENIENIIGTAQTFGEEIPLKNIFIKLEQEDCKELEETARTEVCFEYDNDIKKYIETDDDMDYCPKDDATNYISENERIDENEHTGSEPKKKRRYTTIKPWQQKSFVNELRQQYPELTNQKKLIKTLSEIMKTVKPPAPPLDYYILNGIMLECLYCHQLSETIPTARRHYQEKHGPRYLICYSCGADFRSSTNLYKHEKRCSAPDAAVVLKARAQCLGRAGVMRDPGPLVSTMSLPKFWCELCPAEFQTRDALQSHRWMHLGLRPHRCPSCPAQYTSRSALSRHMKKHGAAQYECDVCRRAFKIKAALAAHLNTHNPGKRFVCERCGMQFAQKFALELHADSRHRQLPPPYACPLCPKRFRRRSVLKEHMKKAHGMDLITRKMFFKTLPRLTETQLKHARVVLKSEEALLATLPQHSPP